MSLNFTKLLPHAVAVVVFLLVTCLYFFPQFEGKKLQQSDFISFQGMSKEILDHKEKTGETTLWTNAMFGGMPAYQIKSPQNYNAAYVFKKIFKMGFDRPIGLFLIGLLSSYILLIALGVNPWLSLFFSFGSAFATNNLILYEAGHMTKVLSLMSAPLLIAGTLLTYRDRRWLGVALFTIGAMMHLNANHYQMTYYLALCLLIFVILQCITDIKSGDMKKFLLNSGLLALAFLFSLGTSASKLLTTYEYSKDTMRGKPILTKNVDTSSSSGVEGLAWEYAMQWSNGSKDLLASFVPMAVGGSSSETIKSNSDFGKALKRQGVNVGRGIPMNTYFGALPFTSGPIYFGAILFFLFLFGALILKGNIKWWAVGAVVLTMLISLGKNCEFFNKILFDYFPLFNKFRTPNSVLSVTSLIIPILAALGVQQVLDAEDKKALIKPMLISGGIIGGICLILALLGPSIFDFSNASDARYQQMGLDTALLEDHRMSMLRSSSLRTLILILIAMAVLWAYMTNKIKGLLAIVLIGLFSVGEMMQINRQYLDADAFVSDRVYNQYFTPRDVDKQILADGDPHYRVLDLSINTFNSSQSSYFHKTIGGYHAAKLQRYQDIIDYHISKNNQSVLDMLNTKYIIGSGNGGEPIVRINPSHLGNAWFINSVKFVDNHDAEVAALSDFDPRGEAIIHQEFKDLVSTVSYNKSGSIELTSYAPNVLIYKTNTDSEQLAVFSEVWYGPDKGWKLYIDGKEAPLLRANYILRAANIPAGTHEVKMVFEPEVYAKGETFSLIASLLCMILVFGGFFLHYRQHTKAN